MKYNRNSAHFSNSNCNNPSQDTRTHVVAELYDTERSYVESLQILVEKYMKPLKGLESNKIESYLVDEIFYTIPEILQHHEKFLTALQDRISTDWDTSQVIGNVFIEAFTNQQIIDTYTAFINNWKNARQAIKVAIQAKPAFERFLEAMSREHRNKLTLDALLIMPVQRIPRYELLIKELIKHTPEDHPDHSLLIEAQKEVHELALKIDRAEKEMIHQEQLRDLESLIEGHTELQHPQRDFIRYDLVTITGSSALTVAKKERILFLFCDLLIMTSVKKKVSRRSNLQSAFANSCNDLSLLEGNKFKLILKVSLDQVEVRYDNDQIQQLERQTQLLITQQKKLSLDQMRDIEADLCTLNQIELLISKISFNEKNKLSAVVDDLSAQLKERLIALENKDSQTNIITPSMQHQLSHDLLLAHSPVSESATDPSHLQSISNVNSLSVQLSQPQVSNESQHSSLKHTVAGSSSVSHMLPEKPTSLPSTGQQDSNTSLEFIISNNGGAKDTLSTNLSSSSVASEPCDMNSSFNQNSSAEGHVSNFDSLIVFFPSVDRRQAFLQAFIEAKQQRYQLQQQRHHQKTFSSSVSLRLSQSESISQRDHRRGRLQHQDELSESRMRGPKSQIHDRVTLGTTRISSAPHNTASTTTIVHQMSAPQSLHSTKMQNTMAPHNNANNPGPYCASCNDPDWINQQHHNHQAVSHSITTNTVCCHEKHGIDQKDFRRLIQPTRDNYEASIELDSMEGHLQQETDYYHSSSAGQVNDSILPLSYNIDKFTAAINLRSTNNIVFKLAPRFMLTLPLNFLNTQHPALQFTCSTLRKDIKTNHKNQVESLTLRTKKEQTVKDESGQLWLCMSNGYVSHVALISLKKRILDAGEETGADIKQCCYGVVPIIQSAGDICKSHINCAVQVKWTKKPILGVEQRAPDSIIISAASESCEGVVEGKNKIESISPPIDIKNKAETNKSDVNHQFSESAPSNGNINNISGQLHHTSISATHLNGRTCPEFQDKHGRGHQKQVCGRHSHHNHQDQTKIRTRSTSPYPQSTSKDRASSKSVSPNICTRYQNHHHHNPHSHHHSHVHGSNQHFHHHHHHHYCHHQSNPQHSVNHAYSTRHNTVPLAELRRALARQDGMNEENHLSTRGSRQLAPPANTPNIISSTSEIDVQDSDKKDVSGANRSTSTSKLRSSTPPARYSNAKSFRSARALRHQASLKTSSILAKLVSGASKGSSYLRKSNQNQDKQSDVDDNDTDNEAATVVQNQQQEPRQEDGTSLDSNILALTVPGANKCDLVSPLSSVSSLNSTNSSITVNSVCASSPNRGSCKTLYPNWSSSTCCVLPSSQQQQQQPPANNPPDESDVNICRLRSRSATVPCRSSCMSSAESLKNSPMCSSPQCPNNSSYLAMTKDENNNENEEYKVSEIVGDSMAGRKNSMLDHLDQDSFQNTALWLGCEDGSLIVIDCLSSDNQDDCEMCGKCHQNLNCHNQHAEIKLSAAICDIKTYKEDIVFVALSNGQLAVFSRNQDQQNNSWSLTSPNLINLAPNELNSTSKLCMIDDDHLWYSYGRSIYVLDIRTLELRSTIIAPTNDPSLQFSMQSVTIDNMEHMKESSTVCVSFKNSQMIQFYNTESHKLLFDIDLLDPINVVLSYGNEIIRQHKTACLKATSMLSIYNEQNDCQVLYIGTSGGIILYLTLACKHFRTTESTSESFRAEWNHQIVVLKHGHSGQVRFLHQVEVSVSGAENEHSNLREKDGTSNVVLVSGGPGVDIYGPNSDQNTLSHDEDNMNHIILWQLNH